MPGTLLGAEGSSVLTHLSLGKLASPHWYLRCGPFSPAHTSAQCRLQPGFEQAHSMCQLFPAMTLMDAKITF